MIIPPTIDNTLYFIKSVLLSISPMPRMTPTRQCRKHPHRDAYALTVIGQVPHSTNETRKEVLIRFQFNTVLKEVGSSSQRTTSTAAQYGCKLKDYLQVKVLELIELLVRQYP
jgi:hypothetical protein